MHKRKHTKDFVFNFFLLYFSAHIPLDLDIIIVKLKSNSSSVSLKLIKTFENVIDHFFIHINIMLVAF